MFLGAGDSGDPGGKFTGAAIAEIVFLYVGYGLVLKDPRVQREP